MARGSLRAILLQDTAQMKAVIKAYDAVLYLMAFIAGATLIWLMVSVILSVTMRNIGVQPFAWLFTSAEYGLLYMTMLGAPWLVRKRGHVHIELVTSALSDNWRNIVSRLVALACVLVCAVLAWKGVDLLLTNIERGDVDTRAYYYPRWLLTITFPLSFAIMAIEFSRFVFGNEIMHTGEAGIHE